MPPAKATKGRTKKAPGLLDNPDYLQLKERVDKMEQIVEFLLYEVKGDLGTRLRKRFYGEE